MLGVVAVVADGLPPIEMAAEAVDDYIDSLSPGSERAVRLLLRIAAKIIRAMPRRDRAGIDLPRRRHVDEYSVPWHQLRYRQTRHVRNSVALFLARYAREIGASSRLPN